MQLFAQIFVVCMVVLLTWWSIRRMSRLRTYDETAEEPFAEDPLADVPAPLKPNPKGRVGAIAMEEPNEDITDAFPPRTV